MPDVSKIKPYYRNDIASTVRSLYFAKKATLGASNMPEKDRNMQWYGALCGWAAVLLAADIEPTTVFTEQDIKFMHSMSKGN